MPQDTANGSWLGHKGPGGFDLRTDVVTTPTPSMLAAVQSCTLLDDVFQESSTTNDLESHVAALAGKEAGLFVLSGTMGNQLALRALLTQPPHGVLCDKRSHIVNYEAGGVSSLTGAMVTSILPENGIHLTLEEIQREAVVSDDLHDCPTRVISLENTLNGMIMPLSEIKRIAAWAREHGIHMHCDGARLWEAVAAGAGSLAEFCAEFDTVSLCFSKDGQEGGGAVGGLRGGFVHPVHTNMCWLDLGAAGCSAERLEALGKAEGLRLMGNRLVISYQVALNEDEVLARLERVFRAALTEAGAEEAGEAGDGAVRGSMYRRSAKE
ncbi:unnamed protein product [Parascedosporium putredinis]|uniref:Aromatic amino acid beta-eliminating lyase/threonine aldolase domain-containing protein n=1 Tax=Parascedosporium putredinis TaxID=1442378 RepID=A0A9P1H765_9PEZI|nr:unnamed protein product [Parascedosporium putredinis]CAI7998366.1 unnamed protein product [Parascedosporium putredinis]